MTSSNKQQSLFHVVGVTIAAAQIFETVFILGSRLALKQADIEILEDIEPISRAKAFKQPVTALLQELGKAQSIEAELSERISRLMTDRHRVVHQLFREFGWPASLSSAMETEVRNLCQRVQIESVEMSFVFTDLLLTWMKLFPATSPTAIKHEVQFKEMAARIERLPGTTSLSPTAHQTT